MRCSGLLLSMYLYVTNFIWDFSYFIKGTDQKDERYTNRQIFDTRQQLKELEESVQNI